jgi:hypothetical protein
MEFIKLTIVIAGFQSELRAVLPKIVELLADWSQYVRRAAIDVVNSFAAQGQKCCSEGHMD